MYGRLASPTLHQTVDCTHIELCNKIPYKHWGAKQITHIKANDKTYKKK